MSKPCRDCGEEIEFFQAGDRWIPVIPGTEDRHRCKLDVRCESCQKIFQGAPWMRVCSECYRSGGNSPERPPDPASKPRKREPLQDDMRFDDDLPPF